MSFLSYISEIVQTINGFLWGNFLMFVLLAVGLFFTIRTNFFSVRFLPHSFTLIKSTQGSTNNHISSFEALSTSLASLVGVGSIAGMAIAISTGGPGAIFWVWVISFLGMSLSVVEHTLGQVFKIKASNNLFMGGPSYYLQYGLKHKTLAKVFAVLLIIAYGIAFNTVQANTISASLSHTFNIDPKITGIVLVIFTAVVLLGGIKRIATISSYLVPIMGILYLGLAVLMIILNITQVPYMFKIIFESAFGLGQFATGAAAYMFLQTAMIGIKRALFSTEAGVGSTPNISATANVSHPAQQGIIGMLGTFCVAFVVCTSTAFIIIIGGDFMGGQMQGVELVQDSLQSHLGVISVYVLVLCIIFFGFTSIIGNFSYAENNINFLNNKPIYLHILRIVVIVSVYVGTVLQLQFVWNLADLVLGLMILINLYAIVMLSNVAIKVLKNYAEQKSQGKVPTFNKTDIKELANQEENVWK